MARIPEDEIERLKKEVSLGATAAAHLVPAARVRAHACARARTVADLKTHVWASREIFAGSRPGQSDGSAQKASGKCLRLRWNRGGPTI